MIDIANSELHAIWLKKPVTVPNDQNKRSCIAPGSMIYVKDGRLSDTGVIARVIGCYRKLRSEFQAMVLIGGMPQMVKI